MVAAGVTAAQALEAQRRKRHELEGRKLGIPGFELAGEAPKTPALHLAVRDDLAQIEALKKPNTHRKYEAVLERLLEIIGARFFNRQGRPGITRGLQLPERITPLPRGGPSTAPILMHPAKQMGLVS